MIITRLIGGLGNQMFQYALGKHLAIKRGTVLKLDISDLIGVNENAKCTIRNYELNNFNITEEIASDKDLLKFKKNENKKVNRIIKKITPYYCRSKIQEKDLSFDKRILDIDDNKYLEGYWQSELYFNEIRDLLIIDFSLKHNISNKIHEVSLKIKGKESISLHVRRGDYVKSYSDYYHIQNFEYYQKALALILEKYSNCNLFVFSDDIEWCKNNLNLKIDTFFVEPNKSFEDIYLMSLCNHNIIANSSFSWWGAWLNTNPDKICIAPKNWFKDQNVKNNIIPEKWIAV